MQRAEIQQHIAALVEGDPEVRRAARLALLASGDPAVLPLCEALESYAAHVRSLEAALNAARAELEAATGPPKPPEEPPDPPEVAAWRDRSYDPDFNVRKAAAEGL